MPKPKTTTKQTAKKPPLKDVALVHYSPSRAFLSAGGPNAVSFIKSLDKLSDDQLMHVLEGTFHAERVAFVLRGAAAYQMIGRVSNRKDNKLGIDGICNQMAKEFSVDGKTLYRDYKIFEVHATYLLELLMQRPEQILPREFFAESVKLESGLRISPQDVIHYYEERRDSTGGYFVSHARRDREKFNQGMSIKDVRHEDTLERMEAINREKRKEPSIIKEKLLTIQVVASHKGQWFMHQILDNYESFSEWFYTRGAEEFGDPPSVDKKKK